MTDNEGRAVRWWSRAAWKLHGTLLAGLALCAIASWIEWRRALEGRALAWVYAFEWPLFAVLGTFAWWRLVHADRPNRRPRRRAARTRAIADDDPGLVAWRNYLTDLESAEGTGTPDPPAR